MAYATLADVENEMTATSTTVESTKVVAALEEVTARIDAEVGYRFEPVVETKAYGLLASRINSWQGTFRFDKPLLSLTSVLVYGNTLSLSTEVEAYINGLPPYNLLRLKDASQNWYTTWYDSDEPPLVKITGHWGFHSSYSDAWKDTGDTVQDNPLTAAATTLTVSDIDGTDWRSRTPRISAGHLLKIEDEFLRVVATDTATNKATVVRGVNGTTAAAHVQTTKVYSWMPEELIKRVCARQAALVYRRRGSYDSPSEFGGGGYEKDLLEELRAILGRYAYGQQLW